MREIKSSTSLIQWTDAELKLENCVTTNFDRTISRQLQHDWHRLKPSTKQLLNDLRILVTLFDYLIRYDCISFWRLINSIKSMSASARHPSLWLLTPAGENIFKNAKDRIYTIHTSQTSKSTKTNPKPKKLLIPVLEENPKWRLLHQVLTEIENKWKERKSRKNKLMSKRFSAHRGARVLVMVKDERTVDTLQSYLIDGKQKTMGKRWLRYLKQVNDRSRLLAKNSGGSSHLSDEIRLLLEEESRVRNLLFGSERNCEGNKNNEEKCGVKRRAELNAVPGWKRMKRKILMEKNRGKTTVHSKDDRKSAAALAEVLEEAERNTAGARYSESSSLDVEEGKNYIAKELDELRVVIRTYSSVEGDQAYLLLNDLRPSYVVLYDAEQYFIRSLEIYSACSILPDENRLHVYFMLFEASSEEKNYLKALEREQNAFERLIQHKKTMSLPLNVMGPYTTQEILEAGPGVTDSYMGGTLPLAVDTRTRKGKQKNGSDKRDIAVDVREFRSSLPSILHQGGMRLAPVTLTVGDFVLSNFHCVERKSIGDLFGSFASGRLFSQAEAMSKHYKCPCLLIEFDPGKTFCLQNINEIGTEIRTDSICSRMSILIMHFPKLRLLWSRNPYETLKLFKTLKANHEEVNVDRAVEKGSNESVDALLLSVDDAAEYDVNEAARDMLLRLPGITVHNARKVMKVAESISELAELPRDKMKELLGPQTGQKLFSFFHQRYHVEK